MRTQTQGDLSILKMSDNRRVFYLTTIPGLESVSHLELCEKWGRAADFFELPFYPEVFFHRGGIEFEAPAALGFALNSVLRTNTRMLMRLASFEAPNENTFVRHLKEIPWRDFFKKNDVYDYKFTSKNSKLSRSSQIEFCFDKVLKKLNVKHKKGGTTLYIRIVKDKCNISFDCAGEASFKRGQGQQGAVASLRASTAHGLLRVLFQGVTAPVDLIDPMCGSGTFLAEALQGGAVLDRPFAYQNIPLGRDVQAKIKSAIPLMTESRGFPIRHVYGFDKDEKAITIADNNLKKVGFENWEVKVQDIFSAKKKEPLGEEAPLVVLNPPWGKRLPGASRDLLTAVWEKHQPQRLGLLMPAHWKLGSIPMQKVRDLPLVTSGVETRFLVFAR